jgi:hypothetical protein
LFVRLFVWECSVGFCVAFCSALAVTAGAAVAPASVADPAPAAGKVSCAVLDELQESYEDDIAAGLGGHDRLRNPGPGDWTALDDADDQAQALSDLIDTRRAAECS